MSFLTRCLVRSTLLAALAVSGCSPATVPWRNPALPQQQWSHDYYSCRRQAERDAGWREESASGPFGEYNRQQAKGLADASLKACMIGLGYQPVEKGRDDQPRPATP